VLADHFTATPSGLTVVADSTAPITTDFTNSTSVWEFANTSGGAVNLEWLGETGSTGEFAIGICYKIVTGSNCTLSVEGVGGLTLDSSAWDYKSSGNITAAANTDNLRLAVPNNTTIRFFFANLQEMPSTLYNAALMPIDTAGSTIAEDSDDLSFALTLNDSEGTLFIDADIYSVAKGGGRVFQLIDASDSTQFHETYTQAGSGSTYRLSHSANSGTAIFTANITNVVEAETRYKIAYRYKAGFYTYFINNYYFYNNTATTMPSGLDTLRVNFSSNFDRRFSGIIRRIGYSDEAYRDMQLFEFW
jgi:hypothetical protein